MALEPNEVVQTLLRQRLRVTAIATLILRDVHAADDIFQQVVLAALENRHQIKDSEHLLAWTLRATRHRAVDLARKRHLRLLPDELLDLIEGAESDPPEAHSTEEVEALHRCLAKLGGPARAMLRMRYDEGLNATSIAGRVQRSTDAVYQTLSRTHRALRECVERELASHSVDESKLPNSEAEE
jgi:RNA polymerase sigma-70 factor, ECF subfamily